MTYPAELNYFDTVSSASKSYARMLEPICKERKLTRNELDVLLFLYNNPGFDRAADIVSRRGIAKSHVSLSVAGLEEKGLLRRNFSEQDRRTAHLELLEPGRAIAAEARERQVQYFAALYQGVSPEEFEIWKNIILKIQSNIKTIENSELTL